MSELTVYYIDDQITNLARRYGDRLARANGFECRPFPPQLEKLDELVDDPPDLFLIDYELNRIQEDDTKFPYQGSVLAAIIRERIPDCPIVLITRDDIRDDILPPNHQKRRQLVERMQMYDELIFKRDLDNHLDVTRQQLASIAGGFRQLGQVENKNKTWTTLFGAMNATKNEAAVLREANPPLEASPPLESGEWIVTSAAYWIRKVVLEFPGILYNSLNAATRLGISEDSFLKEEVQEILAPAEYTGVFAVSHNRWWKDRLFEIAQGMAVQSEIRGPINRTFIQVCKKELGVDLAPSVCVWDRQPVADWVCYVLQKPVKIKHSFRYYPDNRPSVMANARVSFRAIRESRQFDPDLLESRKFDPNLLDIEGVDRLQKIEALPEP